MADRFGHLPTMPFFHPLKKCYGTEYGKPNNTCCTVAGLIVVAADHILFTWTSSLEEVGLQQLVVYFGVQLLVLGLTILVFRRHQAAMIAWVSRWWAWIVASLIVWLAASNVYMVWRYL
jgi:hypothetical protein